MLRLCRRSLAYEDTLRYKLRGPKKGCMVIQPYFDVDEPSMRNAWEDCEEALGLVRAARWNAVPGPTQPRTLGGWDLEALADLEKPPRIEKWHVSSKEETDDEFDMDDPVLNDPILWRQWIESCMINVRKIVPSTFLGPGQVANLARHLGRNPVDYVLINEQISPSQKQELETCLNQGLNAFETRKDRQKRSDGHLSTKIPQVMNYLPEKEFDPGTTVKNIEVIDRTFLLLEVLHARSSSKTVESQIKLARLRWLKAELGYGTRNRINRTTERLTEYMGPYQIGRLKSVVSTAHDESIGEMKKRLIHQEEARLSKSLEQEKMAKLKQRDNRTGNPNVFTMAMIGYTNAGKTRLRNWLCGSRTEDEQTEGVRNLYFETMNQTFKQFKLPSGRTGLIMDSIGVIKRMPALLDRTFNDLRQEMETADVILHVRDISHYQSEKHRECVHQLMDRGEGSSLLASKTIEVWNKIDRLSPEDLQLTLQHLPPNVAPISAMTGDGIDVLRELIDTILDTGSSKSTKVSFPIEEAQRRLAFLHKSCTVITSESDEDTMTVSIISPHPGFVDHFQKTFSLSEAD